MDAKVVHVNYFCKAVPHSTTNNSPNLSYLYRVMHRKITLGFLAYVDHNSALSFLRVYHNQGNIMKMKQLALLLLSLAMLGGFATGCAKSDEDKAKEAVEEAADAVKKAAE